MGGLGNQLFQLAFALYVAKDRPVVLEDWMGNTRRNQSGDPELCGLKLPGEVEVHMYPNTSLLVRRVINLGLRIASRHGNGQLIRKLYEVVASGALWLSKGPSPLRFSRGLGFDPSFQRSHFNSHACGYFQTFEYASQPDILEKLRTLVPISSSDSKSKKSIVSDAIMLHVRLTDYLENSPFGVPGVRYYESGIRYLIGLLGERPIHVYSDDPRLALSRLPTEFSELYLLQSNNEEACVVLEQMRGYSGYVIANSSLSWWGAFLRYDEKAPVVCPEPWFRLIESPARLVPDLWKRLPAHFDAH